MGSIARLPEELVRKIAAGEVVSGAFSVVKELVENSLDAGAKRVEIEIKGGGKSLIVVSDDGEGMDLEDLRLAILPHTTSKISSEEDLYRISTYGFRGEALASIAKVSRMVITSRKRGESLGNRIHVVSGEITKVEEGIETREGTKVEVMDLFFNTPARRKFLKSASVEGRMVVEQVQKFMLSRPDVHFVLVKDGIVVYNSPPVEDLRVRMGLIAPDSKPREMLDVEGSLLNVSVRGLVSRPGVWRRTRSGIFVFVNGRYVLSEGLFKAFERGYGEALEKGKHPIGVIFIELPPNELDVNVHPQKIEVVFSKPEVVHKAVESAISKALRSGWKRPLSEKKKRVEYRIPDRGTTRVQEKMIESYTERVRLAREETSEERVPRFLMVLNDRYILAEDEDGIVLVDYHAAHERIIYERLKEDYKEGIPSSYLVLPLRLDLDKTMISVAENNADILERLGFRFDITESGLVVKAVPQVLPIDEAQRTFLEVLEELRLVRFDILPDVLKKILADMACKRALRTGDFISDADAVEILKELARRGLTSCPHGRPLAFKLTYEELNRYFERE